MKNFRFLILALAAVLVSGHGALALSTETQSSSVRGSGSAQFSDPDEQAPPGLAMSGPNGMTNPGSMNRPSVTAPSIQQRMGVDSGEQSFDHAYNHLQNEK